MAPDPMEFDPLFRRLLGEVPEAYLGLSFRAEHVDALCPMLCRLSGVVYKLWSESKLWTDVDAMDLPEDWEKCPWPPQMDSGLPAFFCAIVLSFIFPTRDDGGESQTNLFNFQRSEGLRKYADVLTLNHPMVGAYYAMTMFWILTTYTFTETQGEGRYGEMSAGIQFHAKKLVHVLGDWGTAQLGTWLDDFCGELVAAIVHAFEDVAARADGDAGVSHAKVRSVGRYDRYPDNLEAVHDRIKDMADFEVDENNDENMTKTQPRQTTLQRN